MSIKTHCKSWIVLVISFLKQVHCKCLILRKHNLRAWGWLSYGLAFFCGCWLSGFLKYLDVLTSTSLPCPKDRCSSCFFWISRYRLCSRLPRNKAWQNTKVYVWEGCVAYNCVQEFRNGKRAKICQHAMSELWRACCRRDNSCLSCKGPGGEDQSGGFYEAGGSFLKLGLPSAYTV